MAELYFATTNENKFREVSDILSKHSITVKMGRIQMREMQSDDLTVIASEKASSAYASLKHDVIVEDDGLFINSLNGFPGPYSAYVLKTIGNAGVLKLMHGVKERKVAFRSVIAYCDNGMKPVTFVGSVEGMIAEAERGSSWGYDPIFVPNGSNGLTFAELGPRKSELSHRRLALDQFAKWYKERSFL